MPKQINKLSAVAVGAARTPGMYADGNGLYLQLSVAGAKSWVFRFRFGGKRRDMALALQLPSAWLLHALGPASVGAF